jgi:adenosylhomocysteine nucleosidase
VTDAGYRSILVVAAMDEEERALVEVFGEDALEARFTSRHLGVAYRTGVRGGRRWHFVRSGIGAVNAALSVAFVCESEKPDAILLLGVGGALHENLAIGDLVLSTAVLQHDSFASLDGGDVRMRAGSLLFTGKPADEVEHRSDAALRAWIREALGKTAYRDGAVLSGAEFVGTPDRKREIARLHPEALLVEMEACGVAQVAERLSVPFVVAKTVADRLRPDGSVEQDFRKCLQSAARNAANVLKSLLQAP